MDTTAVVVIALFAVIIVATLLVFRQRAKIDIKGPGNTGLSLDASNDPAPAVKIEGAKSHSGGLVAQDQTGRGADVKDVEVEKDINVSSAGPGGDSDPKG